MKMSPQSWVKVTVTARKPVSFRVRRLRELHKTKTVAESCPEPPFILREPQDERRVEGDDTGILRPFVKLMAQDERFSPIMVSLSNHTLTIGRNLFSNEAKGRRRENGIHL